MAANREASSNALRCLVPWVCAVVYICFWGCFCVATFDSNSFLTCEEICPLTCRPLDEVCLSKQERGLSHSWHFYVFNEGTVSAICYYSHLPWRSRGLSHAIKIVAYELAKKNRKRDVSNLRAETSASKKRPHPSFLKFLFHSCLQAAWCFPVLTNSWLFEVGGCFPHLLKINGRGQPEIPRWISWNKWAADNRAKKRKLTSGLPS